MAEKQLKNIRTTFVQSVNSTILKDIIDDLLDEKVFSAAEAESVTEGTPRTRDKARDLIDMVMKKGNKSCEILIGIIQNRDHNLHARLGFEVQRREASGRNVSGLETQTQPSITALQSNKDTPTKIPSQETCSPKVENGITLCPQDVYNKIKNDEADQIYDIKEKDCRKRLALIINNRNFDHENERQGSEHDVSGMTRLLQGLGYQVDLKTNLSSQEMDASLKEFSSRPEHEHSDSTFVVIMSHGLRDRICGVHHHKSKPDILHSDNIFEIFNNENCKGLRWKPKVIIIQACRGVRDGAIAMSDFIDVAADACQIPSEKDLEDDAMQKLVIESDFLCFYSSTPDTKSWRSVSTGSFFIQKLIEVTQNEAWTCSMEKLFRKVQLSFKKSKYQMPTRERTTAMKDFYLFPGH